MTDNIIFYPYQGGMDQKNQPIIVPAGRAIGCLNYESVSDGYRRVDGYERFDGRAAPSQETFSTATFVNANLLISPGATIVGVTSGATGRAIATPVLTGGTWGAGTAAGTLAMHKITGNFLTNESLTINGTGSAQLSGQVVEGDPDDGPEALAWIVAAREYLREQIQPVPGSGPVRGVLWYNDRLHAWRDNVAVDKGVPFHSTAGGWVADNLGTSLKFKNGSTQIMVGNTITGAASGATATVRRIETSPTGTWGAGTAKGSLIIDPVSGSFVLNEIIKVGATNVAVADSASGAMTFPPGGRYDFEIENFYGTTTYERAYGVNGVGPAFSFDGVSAISISTGMPDDRPFLISAHKNHLFLGFPKGSLQHSDLGEPHSFTAVLGAAELGMGHELTEIMPNAGGSLLVSTEKSIGILTGNDSSDWQLEKLSADRTGAKRFSAQRIGTTIYLDDRGVRSLSTTQAYGDFRVGTFTDLIQPTLDNKRKTGAYPVASCVVKAKDQYLLFFSDGTGISIYFGRKQPEPMLFEYPFIVSCITQTDDGRVFVGAADGYVYEINKGDSFDGDSIDSFVQIAFGYAGNPRLMKRYKKAVTEITAGPRTTVGVIADFDYGSSYQPFSFSDAVMGKPAKIYGTADGGIWSADDWGDFFWDGQFVGQAETYLQGLGTSISLIYYSNSAVQKSDILHGVTLIFGAKGNKR